MTRAGDDRRSPSDGRALPPRLDPRAGRPRRPAVRPAAATAGSTAVRPGPAPSFRRVLGLTLLGALVPGVAFLAAGYRRLGATVLAGLAVLVAVLAWLATAGRPLVVRLAVSPTGLLAVIVAAVGLAIVWSLVVIAGYRMLAPDSTTRGQHLIGGVLVTLLALGVAAPAFEAAQLAAVQRNLITGLFADGGRSATVPDSAAIDPWGSKRRVNVLLLGGDGGDGRTGVRTDTVIVASIDTETGATTTFSLPRNLEEVPFPPGSPLAKVYPDGFTAGSESESLLNAIYRNGPAAYPNILGPTDNPGADFLKLAVGQVLGLTIDYYALVNLAGFSQIIDALGGITVNVNYYVPIGGNPGTGQLPDDYIAPGPNQKLNGARALDFARGRFGLDDYKRMARQRCAINAMVQAADPLTVLSRYQRLAATTRNIVTTDIPQSAVGDFAGLALKVKDAGIRSVVFDNTVIEPAYPDYGKIRRLVQQALGSVPSPVASAPSPPSTAAAAPGGGAAPQPSSGAPVADAVDACAYDPVAAQQAIDQGEPPTRRR